MKNDRAYRKTFGPLLKLNEILDDAIRQAAKRVVESGNDPIIEAVVKRKN